jgi:hypothetical protein
MAAKNAGTSKVAPLADRVVVKPLEDTEQICTSRTPPRKSRSRAKCSPSALAVLMTASASRWK